MKIKNLTNGGIAEVDDKLGADLVATGVWAETKAAAPKRTRRPAAKPAQEPEEKE